MPLYPPASSGGTPGGSDTQVQYNDNGAFGGANTSYSTEDGEDTFENSSGGIIFRDSAGNEIEISGAINLVSAAGDNIFLNSANDLLAYAEGDFLFESSTGVSFYNYSDSLFTFGGTGSDGKLDFSGLTGATKIFTLPNTTGTVLIEDGSGIVTSADSELTFKTASGSGSITIGDDETDIINGDRVVRVWSSGGATTRGVLDFSAIDTAEKTFSLPNTTGTVDVTASSKRFKKNIKPMSFNALDVVKEIEATEFAYDKEHGGRKAVGLIAEQVEKVDPRLVMYDKEGEPTGVYYTELTAVLIKALQEANDKIDSLEKRLDKLER